MLKRFTSHTLMALAEASLVAVLVVGLVAGTAFAGKGGGGKPSAGGGTASLACAVNPDPVAVGGVYTISGANYPTGRQLLIHVVNAHGTLVLFSGASTDGQFSASAYANWAESHTVKVYDNSGRRAVLLATCEFSAS